MARKSLLTINSVAIVAALYLPACGDSITTPTPDPVVQPPVHTGSGKGTLRVSAPSGLTAAIITVDGIRISPELIGLPHDLELKAEPHDIALNCDQWDSPPTRVMVAEDTMSNVKVAARPDVSRLEICWNVSWYNGDGQMYHSSVECLKVQDTTPGEPLWRNEPPCETGRVMTGASFASMCVPDPFSMVRILSGCSSEDVSACRGHILTVSPDGARMNGVHRGGITSAPPNTSVWTPRS